MMEAPAPSASKEPILVIGAGVAGLQTTRALLREGFHVVCVEEAADVGGVWQRNYQGYALQVPWYMYTFPEFPYPPRLRPMRQCPSGAEVHRYIRAYAKHFGLYNAIRLHTRVQHLELRERTGDSGSAGLVWRAVLHDVQRREQYELYATYVVVASGAYSTPHIPAFPGQSLFKGLQVHSRNFSSASVAHGKRVVIVGGGKSALDCASTLTMSNAAKKVTIIKRQRKWPFPSRLGSTGSERLLYTRAMAAMLPAYYEASLPRRALSALCAPFKACFWSHLEGHVRRSFEVPVNAQPGALMHDLLVDGQIVDETWQIVQNDRRVEQVEGSVCSITPSSVVMEGGAEVECDLILYCTGFLRTYDFLDERVRARLDAREDGLWLYKNILPIDVPALAFVGSEVNTLSNILTHALQAEWLVGVLKGQVVLPGKQAMAASVISQRAWKGRTMPHRGQRSAALTLYMLDYHDSLLSDLRVRSTRKGRFNVFAECFTPYTAADYAPLFPAPVGTEGTDLGTLPSLNPRAVSFKVPSEAQESSFNRASPARASPAGHSLAGVSSTAGDGPSGMVPRVSSLAVSAGERGSLGTSTGGLVGPPMYPNSFSGTRLGGHTGGLLDGMDSGRTSGSKAQQLALQTNSATGSMGGAEMSSALAGPPRAPCGDMSAGSGRFGIQENNSPVASDLLRAMEGGAGTHMSPGGGAGTLVVPPAASGQGMWDILASDVAMPHSTTNNMVFTAPHMPPVPGSRGGGPGGARDRRVLALAAPASVSGSAGSGSGSGFVSAPAVSLTEGRASSRTAAATAVLLTTAGAPGLPRVLSLQRLSTATAAPGLPDSDPTGRAVEAVSRSPPPAHAVPTPCEHPLQGLVGAAALGSTGSVSLASASTPGGSMLGDGMRTSSRVQGTMIERSLAGSWRMGGPATSGQSTQEGVPVVGSLEGRTHSFAHARSSQTSVLVSQQPMQAVGDGGPAAWGASRSGTTSLRPSLDMGGGGAAGSLRNSSVNDEFVRAALRDFQASGMAHEERMASATAAVLEKDGMLRPDGARVARRKPVKSATMHGSSMAHLDDMLTHASFARTLKASALGMRTSPHLDVHQPQAARTGGSREQPAPPTASAPAPGPLMPQEDSWLATTSNMLFNTSASMIMSTAADIRVSGSHAAISGPPLSTSQATSGEGGVAHATTVVVAVAPPSPQLQQQPSTPRSTAEAARNNLNRLVADVTLRLQASLQAAPAMGTAVGAMLATVAEEAGASTTLNLYEGRNKREDGQGLGVESGLMHSVSDIMHCSATGMDRYNVLDLE